MLLHGLQFLSCLLLLASKVSSNSVSENATYEDLTFTPLLESPIGSYKFLNYTSWVVGGPSTPGVGVGGLASKSPPNHATTAVDVQTLRNTGTPTFTIEKPYNSVHLLDLFFGCALRLDESTIGAATQCTITIAGFQPITNKEVALGSYTFTPPVSPVASVPMIHAVLSDTFSKWVHNVTIIQSPATAALLVDNLHYEVST